ncbi:MAG: MFS transporter [Acidobacteria bacterium]|nr:MFS transporter [Acidobacteriota bacterium]MBI3261978.1 MFS transporter [Acidobacteriota bacterium]
MRRNLFVVTAVSFMGFTGFTLVMPFLPLYITTLGVTDVGEVATWTGLCLGVTPAITAVLSPFWGRVADRFGRKLMVERSLVSFIVIMAAMAFVTRPWHVLALRIALGFFAGYGGLAVAMAAESAPRDRMASAIGRVQMAQRLGPALGPVLGGLVAQMAGLRRAFFVTAGFYAIGFFLMLLLYEEPSRPRGGRDTAAGGHVTFRSALAFQNFFLVMAVIFGVQFADRSLGPILPLYVAHRGVDPERVPLLSGALFSIAAGLGAVGNTLCGRALRRFSARALITFGAGLGLLGLLLFTGASHAALLAIGMAIFGFGIGLALTAAYTAAGRVIPEGAQGAGFGLLTSAYLAALAISPVIAGLLSARDLRLALLTNAAALGIVALGAWKSMRGEDDGSRPVEAARSTIIDEV